MDLQAKIAAIEGRRRFGMKPGLGRIQSLLSSLGNPERELACIHVAGTNGKGSVAAMSESILRAAGLGATGLYTSPHLVFFNERIRIGGEPIGNEALGDAIDEVLAADSGEATFFELATATAFCAFRAAGVRVAVVETGLGGRLDATNVVIPVVSAITNIGLEHREWLGDDIPAIAREKAGIVKPGRPVVLGAMANEAIDVITRRAKEVGAPVFDFTPSVSSRTARDGSRRVAFEDAFRAVSGIRLPLDGAYQRENLATAIAAVEAFSEASGIPIPDGAFKQGLEGVRWPCRFQTVSGDPPVVVDGAHNPPAAEALSASLSKLDAGPLALVAGFCGDKDVMGFLRTLKPRFRAAFATETPNGRTLPAEKTAALMAQAGYGAAPAFPDWRDALDAARDWARGHGGAVVVCGSLFLAGAVAESFGALPWKTGVKSASEALHGR